MVSPREYGALKMNTCCCASCRDLGYFAFDLLRELVDLLKRVVTSGLPSWCDEKTLLARIDQEERFYAGQFQAHLDEGSSTAEHCRRHLLSALADERFVCDCDHARADGGAVPDLETQEERIRRTHHRAARTTEDWEKTCVICADASEDEEKTGRMYCCLYCATVIHKKCGIKHDRSDFPHDDDESEWVCVTCAELESARRHDSRCLECESLGFLLRDLTTLADLARHQIRPAKMQSLPSGSSPPPLMLLISFGSIARTRSVITIRISFSVCSSNFSLFMQRRNYQTGGARSATCGIIRHAASSLKEGSGCMDRIMSGAIQLWQCESD